MVFYLSIHLTPVLKLYYLNDGFDLFNSKVVKFEQHNNILHLKNSILNSIIDANSILNLLDSEYPNQYNTSKILECNLTKNFSKNEYYIPEEFCLILINPPKINLSIVGNESKQNADTLNFELEVGQLLFFENFNNLKIVFDQNVKMLMLYKRLVFKLILKSN